MSNNNEFAFPHKFSDGWNNSISSGMTLRDYFAANAMNGFNREMVAYDWDEDVTNKAAKRAYEIADAMLEARK